METLWYFVLDSKDQKMKDMYYNQTLPAYMKAMEARLDDNGSYQFIVGKTMTIADFDNANLAYTFFYNDFIPEFKQQHKKYLEEYKTVDKYFKGLGTILSDYLAQRPVPQYPY